MTETIAEEIEEEEEIATVEIENAETDVAHDRRTTIRPAENMVRQTLTLPAGIIEHASVRRDMIKAEETTETGGETVAHDEETMTDLLDEIATCSMTGEVVVVADGGGTTARAEKTGMNSQNRQGKAPAHLRRSASLRQI